MNKNDRIFQNALSNFTFDLASRGAIRHLALLTDDVDETVRKVKSAGYEVFVEPGDKVIDSAPEYKIRMAFCFGPLGEQLEFFSEY